MKILFVRIPRRVWPFNRETSAFWPPLGMLSLAGEVLRAHPDWMVRIIDCPGGKIGWGSLQRMLTGLWKIPAITGTKIRTLSDPPLSESDLPDVLCLGEETVSSDEAILFARWIKQRFPQITIIGGGIFFSYVYEEPLRNGGFDFIVRGEGERTLLELLEILAEGGNSFYRISGLVYRRGSEIHVNPPRSPISNLDELPWPAWDLLDMAMYGRGSRHHPGLVAVEHSRGCFDRCHFCVLWNHMGKVEDANVIKPWYRQKSPERCFQEITLLARKYHRQTFGWVDPTFNGDAGWLDEFSDLVLRSGLKITQTAWVRADGIIRDHQRGVLKKAVRAGLRQLMIGVERSEPDGLGNLNKHNNNLEITREAFDILNKHYPEVFKIGSVIFGLWNETRESLRRLSALQDQLGMDYCFFIPLTPNPGTETYHWAQTNGVIEVTDRSFYNFHTPVLRTRYFSARQLEWLYWWLLVRPSPSRLVSWVRTFKHSTEKRHRGLSLSLLRHGVGISIRAILNRLKDPWGKKAINYGIVPKWYNS